MTSVILFDLDDTLIVEEEAAAAAFRATAELAVARYHVDAAALAVDAREAARVLWYASPVHSYCMRVGISSWEGLWCRFEAEAAAERWLREWAPTYRRESWLTALAAQSVNDERLAGQLGERFPVERRRRREVYPEVTAVLDRLRGSHALGVVTNGASCLQREKLAAANLSRYFDVVVVSAEVGAAKPEPVIFEHALAQFGVPSANALMVGDSFTRDVEGATRAGLDAVWLNRTARARPRSDAEVVEISTLEALPAVLR